MITEVRFKELIAQVKTVLQNTHTHNLSPAVATDRALSLAHNTFEGIVITSYISGYSAGAEHQMNFIENGIKCLRS